MKGADMNKYKEDFDMVTRLCALDGRERTILNYGIEEGRAKAIDEFVKEIEAEYDNDGCPNVTDYLDYKISIRDLHKIAEQLKGGAE